jgi:hypothetical protein
VEEAVWNSSSLIERLLPLFTSTFRQEKSISLRWMCVDDNDHPRPQLLFLPNYTRDTRPHSQPRYRLMQEDILRPFRGSWVDWVSLDGGAWKFVSNPSVRLRRFLCDHCVAIARAIVRLIWEFESHPCW